MRFGYLVAQKCEGISSFSHSIAVWETMATTPVQSCVEWAGHCDVLLRHFSWHQHRLQNRREDWADPTFVLIQTYIHVSLSASAQVWFLLDAWIDIYSFHTSTVEATKTDPSWLGFGLGLQLGFRVWIMTWLHLLTDLMSLWEHVGSREGWSSFDWGSRFDTWMGRRKTARSPVSHQ